MTNKSLIGKKIARLTIIEEFSNNGVYCVCICDCGNKTKGRRSYIISGHKTSCGCAKVENGSKMGRGQVTHGLSNTRFYRIWDSMRKRCHNEKHNEYHRYGAKGIKVCEEWHTFENFMKDMYDTYIEFEEQNGKDSATIDRISSHEDYCKDNCRWATQQEQARNRSNNISVILEGVEYKTLKCVAEAYNLPYWKVYQRYRSGKRGMELVIA